MILKIAKIPLNRIGILLGTVSMLAIDVYLNCVMDT